MNLIIKFINTNQKVSFKIQNTQPHSNTQKTKNKSKREKINSFIIYCMSGPVSTIFELRLSLHSRISYTLPHTLRCAFLRQDNGTMLFNSSAFYIMDMFGGPKLY